MSTSIQPLQGYPALSLMPTTTQLSEDGRISVAGVPIASIAAEYGTPAYVLDVATFRGQARRFVDGLAERWPNSEVLFASKAFPALAMYELAASERLSIDVAGDGELRMALAANVDPRRVFFHGNAKTDSELELALSSGVGTIVIDNPYELERLESLTGAVQDVMVRIIPGVSPRTHPSQSTGADDSKFGVRLDQAIELMGQINRSSRLRLRGVHLHIGSQILDLTPFEDAVRRIAAVGTQEAYDIGGGLGVKYTYDDHAPAVEEYLDAVTSSAKRLLPATSRLIIEPGRSLVARAGFTVYSVVNVKRTGRSFVAVNGGMADNLDVALTGQRFEAVIDGRMRTGARERFVVVGRQCESGDTLIDDIELPPPAAGDLLVVPVTGAYTYTLANNYNGAYVPPVVFVEDGSSRLASRRQTFEDVLSLQLQA